MTIKKIGLPKFSYLMNHLFANEGRARYMEKLFRRVNMASSHAKVITEFLIKYDLVIKKQIDGRKYLELTPEGEEMARCGWQYIQSIKQFYLKRRDEFSDMLEVEDHLIYPTEPKHLRKENR